MQIIPSLILSLLGSTLFITTPSLANEKNIEYSDLKINLGCKFELANNTKFYTKNTYVNKKNRLHKSMIENNYFFEDSSIQVSNDILLDALHTNSSLSNKLIASELTNCFQE